MSTVTAPADASVELLVGQIADEFTQRLNRGERPTVEEYAARHPAVAGLLRQVLPALGLLRRRDVEAGLTDTDPNIGAVLGDFRIVRELGRGGMGIVYEAEQLSLKRQVALKVLPFAATLDPRQIQRFKNESELAGGLQHKHIVTVYCVGCERGVHFYAMKLIEGHSLAVLIKEMRRMAGLEANEAQRTGPYLPPPSVSPGAPPDTAPLALLTSEGSARKPEYFRTVARLGLEAAQGLEYAHMMGVRHRDIKPANLLVDSNGELSITDFGLAQMRSDTGMTLTGELLGTLRYMSPEQALAQRVPVDERTDIYSLGATLYELLTLEPAFSGGDREELLRRIISDDPKRPRRLNRHIPADLETIVLKAMAKAPADRYASARALTEDLRLFLEGQPIKARRESRPRWLWRKARRHATALLLALSAVLSAVVLSLVALHLSRPSPEEEESRRQQRALAALTQQLDAKHAVSLIGEAGPPGYHNLITSRTAGRPVQAPDGAFSVQAWNHTLVELLPDPRLKQYRFRAEVRHEWQANHESRVGIYFFHSQRKEGQNVTHFHGNVAFNDLDFVGPPGPDGVHHGNNVGLEMHRQTPDGIAHDSAYVFQASRRFLPARAFGRLGPWRKIDVEVRPQSVKVFWEGNLFATTPRAVLMMSARPLSARPQDPLPANAPEFSPRGGLGLFVSLGVASFRNVVVEPLGEDN
jgi:serine/threonine protein kinase